MKCDRFAHQVSVKETSSSYWEELAGSLCGLGIFLPVTADFRPLTAETLRNIRVAE